MTTHQPAPGLTEPLAYSLADAATTSSLSTDSLVRAIERGHLSASRPTPGRIVILRDDLVSFLRGAVA